MNYNDFMSHFLDAELSSNAKLVMFILIAHRDKYTGLCNPSFSRISIKASLSAKSVQRGVRELEESGFIKIEKKKAFRTGYKLNHYFIDIELLDTKSTSKSTSLTMDTTMDTESYKPIKPTKPIYLDEPEKINPVRENNINKSLEIVDNMKLTDDIIVSHIEMRRAFKPSYFTDGELQLELEAFRTSMRSSGCVDASQRPIIDPHSKFINNLIHLEKNFNPNDPKVELRRFEEKLAIDMRRIKNDDK